MRPPLSCIVDSGAYSAFTQGKEVNLQEYTDFLCKNQEYITANVNLDVINPDDPETAAAAGWRNYQSMRDRGLKVMPVYHARENVKWLDKMLDDTDYIGLSGTSLVSPLEHKSWYHLCWNYATDLEGKAIARFHAFGDTAADSMAAFPWYSVDSATWMIQGGRAARVQLQGKSYQLRSTMCGDNSFLSEDDPLPKKDAWYEEMRLLGVDPEAIMKVNCTRSQMAMIRSYVNAVGLLKLRDRTAHVTTYKARPSLQMTKRQLNGGFERKGPAQFYFVISPSAWYFNYPILTLLKVKHILVSYFYITTAPEKFWMERFVPFLYDPEGFCQQHPKLKANIEKIGEVLDRSGALV